MVIRLIFLCALFLSDLAFGVESPVDYKHPEASGFGKVICLREDFISARKALVWSVSYSELNKWCEDRGLKVKARERDVDVGSIIYFIEEDSKGGRRPVRDVIENKTNMAPFGTVNDAVVFYFNEDTLSEYRIVYDKVSGIAFFWSSSN